MLILEVEDSRCPKDVQCIWAGEVTARVLYLRPGRWSVETLHWDESGSTASGGLRIAGLSDKYSDGRGGPVQLIDDVLSR
ncbi:hypothetical protein [Deinococcus radiophilus]|uniref:hypothetical protein n=1 Tax=Deinococcus radiophilus TaxID=32062 RepID=UPI001473A980|nr:hypothetical protein [Deinococcus radiophilus]UFA50182.1 hypothetical protein LMT64_09935 [Deinococcus radiophilus]